MNSLISLVATLVHKLKAGTTKPFVEKVRALRDAATAASNAAAERSSQLEHLASVLSEKASDYECLSADLQDLSDQLDEIA